MSKTKVVGVGNAGNTFRLLEAGRGHVMEPRVCRLWELELRRDLLLNKTAGIVRRAEMRKMV